MQSRFIGTALLLLWLPAKVRLPGTGLMLGLRPPCLSHRHVRMFRLWRGKNPRREQRTADPVLALLNGVLQCAGKDCRWELLLVRRSRRRILLRAATLHG